MREGYDVCIFNGRKWNMYTTMDESEKDSAIHLANDIKNNHSAVCVLWHTQMRVVFYVSKDPTKKISPQYREVKKSLNSKEIKAHRSRGNGVAEDKEFTQTTQMRKQKKKRAPVFRSSEQRRITITALGVMFGGSLLSLIIPLLLPEASPVVKVVSALAGIILSALSSLIYYIFAQRNNGLSTPMRELHSVLAENGSNLSKEQLDKLTKEDFDKLEDPKEDASKASTDTTTETTTASTNTEQSAQPTEKQEHTEQEETLEDFKNERILEDELEIVIAEVQKLRDLTPLTSLDKNEGFGFTLYCMGAARAICEKHRIPLETATHTVPLVLTRINQSPSETTETISHLGEYSLVGRYQEMMNSGYNDTKARLNEDEANIAGVELALANWVRGSEQVRGDGDQKYMAVIMTDITHAHHLDEQKTQDILNAHNDIIRKIIAEHNGVEAKQTKDGMLIHFSMVKHAAKAAETILSSIQYFSKSLPDLSFSVRLGLASGEASTSDKGVSGDAVNLAMALAKEAEFNTASVCDEAFKIIQGQDFTFEPGGMKNVPGFGDMQVHKMLASIAHK